MLFHPSAGVLIALALCSSSLGALAQSPALPPSFAPLAALAPEHARSIPTKPYRALSTQEMAGYKQLWPTAGPADEPPYPVERTAEVLQLALERARGLNAREDLIVVADVNEQGQVTNVRPRRYFDDQLLKSVTWLLVDTNSSPPAVVERPAARSFRWWFVLAEAGPERGNATAVRPLACTGPALSAGGARSSKILVKKCLWRLIDNRQ